MSMLFSEDDYLVRRLKLDYEFTGRDGVAAYARFRSSTVEQGMLDLVRDMFSPGATAESNFVVTDAADEPQLTLHRASGRNAGFEMAVTRADGEPIGTAGATASLLATTPEIHLADASGADVGRLSGAGRMDAYDATGARIAAVRPARPDRPLFGAPRYRLQFLGKQSSETRALVVAGLIGWFTTQ